MGFLVDYKLVAFDMDGTLVKEHSSWRKIHCYFSTEEAALKNLSVWKRGRIDYLEFMCRDIALWKPTPHISKIEEILSDFKLAPHASEVMSEIRRRGCEISIVTGGLDVLANKVAKELQITHVLANGLEVDENGYLIGEGILRVDPRRKFEALLELIDELGINEGECVCVGDSEYDVSFLERAGMAVAIGDDRRLVEAADVVIPDFGSFDRLLEYL